MTRRFLLALAGILLLGWATARADWTLRVHHGGTADEFPVATIDSITFFQTAPVPMVLVPAGVFTMGDGVSYCGVDEPEVTLTRAFHLGQYEVTNLEFRDAVQWAYDHGYVQAVADSIYDNMDGSSVELVDLAGPYCQVSFAGGVFTIDPGKENYPMVEVSWYGGAAFCDWLSMQAGLPRAYDHATWECNGGDPYGAAGYRLPTDAEWEYAAQFDDERIYPWGNEAPSCDRAVYEGCGGVQPVGSRPGAPLINGAPLYDMAGNAWEWCNDRHRCNVQTDPVTDPVGPLTGSWRVLRSGGWYYIDDRLRCSWRVGVEPWYSGIGFGFRIARTE
jgi:formylglycine-generating enzyme required for sulfatase activity